MRGGVGAFVVRVGLAAAGCLALAVGGAAGAQGQSPDFPAFVQINKAMATMAGLQAKGMPANQALEIAQAQVLRAAPLVTEAGKQYQLLALQFMADQAASDACIELVKANPNIEGVNEFLYCIAPVNQDIVATQREMGRYDTQIATNSSPVTGVGTTPSLADTNIMLVYAQTVGTVSDVASGLKEVKEATEAANAVVEIGPQGIVSLDFPKGVLFSDPANGKSVVVFSAGTGKQIWSAFVGDETLPGPVERALNGPLAPSSELAPAFVGARVPVTSALRAPSREAGAYADDRTVLVAVARKGLPVSVGYTPPWAKAFLRALLNGRIAEESQLEALIGSAPRAHPHGPARAALPGATATVGKTLAAVLANQAGRAPLLKALNTDLRAADRSKAPERRRTLRRRAAAAAVRLAALYRADPRLRAAAVKALRPPARGRRLLVVVKAPAAVDLDPASLLRDPRRDAASRRLARGLGALAARLRRG